MRGDAAVDFREGCPFHAGDFFRVRCRRLVGHRAEQSRKLVRGLCSGRKLCQKLKRGSQPQFLVKLPPGGCFVILAGVEVAGGRGSPAGRILILRRRSKLQQQIPGRVEDKDARCAMQQVFRVDDRSGGLADHLVVRVNDVEDFFSHRSTCVEGNGASRPVSADCRLSLCESRATFAERKATISDQPTQGTNFIRPRRAVSSRRRSCRVPLPCRASC